MLWEAVQLIIFLPVRMTLGDMVGFPSIFLTMQLYLINCKSWPQSDEKGKIPVNYFCFNVVLLGDNFWNGLIQFAKLPHPG